MVTHTDSAQQQAQWQTLVVKKHFRSLAKRLKLAPAADVALLFNTHPLETMQRIFDLFPRKKQGLLFTHLSEKAQQDLYTVLTAPVRADVFSQMASDHRADFFQQLDATAQSRLLPYLSPAIRRNVIKLSSYAPETAGGIMSTDFVTVTAHMTAKQALEALRNETPSSHKLLYYIYVTNAEKQMIGIVSLKCLVMSDPSERIANLLKSQFVAVQVDEDQETVAHKIEHYDLVAIPVLNKEEQLLGIVRYDEAMDVIREEQTEDMEKFMGIVSEDHESDYLTTSSWQHFKRRIGWIAGLFAMSIVSGSIMHRYQGLIDRISLLALYLPALTDTGGNTGGQAATVVIRALALGQVTLRNWLTIIIKEAKVALCLAPFLFGMAYGKVWLLDYLYPSLNQHIPIELGALVIALSLSLQVISATVIGAAMPLIAKKFQGDPALAASPAITTVVDITGLLIYFTVANLLLSDWLNA